MTVEEVGTPVAPKSDVAGWAWKGSLRFSTPGAPSAAGCAGIGSVEVVRP